jgi:hypothetical protein
MGPGTGQGAPSRTTPMDTLRQLAGDVSEFLTSRADMVRNTPGYQPTAATGRERLDQIANRSPEELRALYDQVWSNPAFGPLVMGIKAFHGSPHDFDKFDLSKIGTGEGAQAYGHGIYLAQSKDVARGYRDALSDPSKGITGLAYGKTTYSPDDFSPEAQAVRLLATYGSKAEAVREAVDRGRDDVADLIRRMRKDRADVSRGGRMYEVDINTTPDRLLDWDKPVSDQPKAVRDALGDSAFEKIPLINGGPLSALSPEIPPVVRAILNVNLMKTGDIEAAIAKSEELLAKATPERQREFSDAIRLIRNGNLSFGNLPSREMPESAYRRLKDAYGGPEAASGFLRGHGVDGIRYFDQGSRSAKDGTRNYVIFDDSLINILRKYGILAPLMGAGAVEAVSGAPEQ